MAPPGSLAGAETAKGESVKKVLWPLAAVVFVALAMTATASSRSDVGSADSAVYIVQMIGAPVVGYSGDIAGYPATKPAKGKKVDASSSEARKYSGLLEQKHDRAINQVGGADKLYDYSVVFNGFAAKLTASQAEKMATTKGVLVVEPAQNFDLDTSSTPAFLGLDKADGLWNQLGGLNKGGVGSGAGEDVVIGDVDGGYWPENPAFSDRKVDGSNGNAYPHKVTGFSGICQAGEDFPASTCNNKVIAARFYNAGIGAVMDAEFVSPRDYGGHGSHTASTMAGNNGVQATGDAASFGKVSGIAPRARLSVYKACWATPAAPAGSCSTADTTAAIDQAVADGVDAINFSISGTSTAFTNSTEVAFLFAAAAGVYVSASAGNSGPTVSTVAHPSPWITTTAAGTHNRDGRGSAVIDGVTYNGGSSAATAVSGQLVVYGAPVNPLPADRARRNPRSADAAVLPRQRAAVDRKDRGLPARRQRPHRQEPRREAGGGHRHDHGQLHAELGQRRPALRPVSAPEQRLVRCDRGGGAGREDRVPHEGDDRLRRGRAVHGVVLVPRPASGRRRRHPQAGHHGSGPGHPRGRCASGEPWSGLRPLQRYVDVEPAHDGPRCAPAPGPSGLVADDDQVGVHDHGVSGS